VNRVRRWLDPLLVTLSICALPPTAWAINGDSSNVRPANGGCWAFAKTAAVVEYSTVDPRNPRAPAQPVPDKDLRQGPDGKGPDIQLNTDECTSFLAAPSDALFNVAYQRSWYRRSDFITASELTPIARWTTRYVYRITALSGVGAELGLNENMLSLGMEMDAYRASRIRDGLFVFSPDAHWIDTERQVRWKMYLTPTGGLVLIETSGKFAVEANASFHRSYPMSCEKSDIGQWVCGLRFSMGSCDLFAKTRKPDSMAAKECEPEKRRATEETVGRIALWDLDLNPDWHPGITIKPDKIIISRRYAYSRRDPNQTVLSFYARFDDPIRPIYFTPGLLFTDKAKPHPGKSRPGERVMTPVCLVDCPDQLAAQGLLTVDRSKLLQVQDNSRTSQAAQQGMAQ
jgi:hypothetical protein